MKRLLALLVGLCLGFGLAFGAGTARAQDYPSRSVRIIVPFAPGGSADVYARFLATRLQESWGQSFVIDNRPGAGSIIGTDAVAKSAPDGYTLLLMSNTHTVNESLIPNKPFQLLRDFVPIAPLSSSDLVLVARSELPARDLGELLKLAKARPGALSYASSGPGTPYHMAGELFKSMAGVDILHVPYKGSSAAMWYGVPGPEDAYDSAPGLALASFSNSPRSRAGRSARATSTRSDELIGAIGTKSRSSWNGLLGISDSLTVCVFDITSSV